MPSPSRKVTQPSVTQRGARGANKKRHLGGDEAHRNPAKSSHMRLTFGYIRAVCAIHLPWSARGQTLMEMPTMSARQVTDEEGRVWECRPETDVPPGCDVNLVCTTASLRAPVRLKISWQWERIAERGLARMISAAAPRMSSGERSLPPSVNAKASRKAKSAKR